jgi:putative ATP-binding cassette transporter
VKAEHLLEGSLAELWPTAAGLSRRPANDHATMFVSQLPYLALCDLRTVVSYPARSTEIADELLCDALHSGFLGPPT